MKYKCCGALLHKLAINPDNINFCCSPYDNKLQYLNNYNGEKININDYLKKRSYYVEMFKSGNIPEPCRNCSYVEEKEWDEKVGFSFISISSRTKCSCNCIYCVQSKGREDIKKSLNERECWDVTPVLKDLYNANLILPNCIYIIGGGEPTEFPEGELESLLYLGMMTNSNILVLSNGIIYSESLAKALSVAKINLKISVDAGYKETYEKIKRVKKFDDVWSNIKKYVNFIKDNIHADLQIKYIIIPGINDNVKEAKEFMRKCLAANVRTIEIVIEFDYYERNKDKPVSPELKETIQYFNSMKSKGVTFLDCPEWFEKQL